MIDPDFVRAILTAIDELESEGVSPIGSERLIHLGEKNNVLRHLHYLVEEGLIRGQEIRTGVGGMSLQRIALIELTSAGRKALQPQLLAQSNQPGQATLLIRQAPIEAPLLVFISSAIDKMKGARQATENAITSISLTQPWLFEKTPASSQNVEESYLAKVRACDIFVMLVGSDYSSAVAREYDTAQKAGKPTLVFIQRAKREDEQQRFIDAIPSKYTWFDAPSDLYQAVHAAVSDEVTGQFRTARQSSNSPTDDQLFHLYVEVCGLLRERRADVWAPEIGSQEHRDAERMVEKGWLERAPGLPAHPSVST